MNKLLPIIFAFLVAGCNASESFIDPLKPEFETISFDVVQKQLLIEQNLPEHVQILLTKWFDQRVKIDGFDGDMKFIISFFKQDISSISDGGEEFDVTMSFKVLFKTFSFSNKTYRRECILYGSITGVFSLNEFETVIQNTQKVT